MASYFRTTVRNGYNTVLLDQIYVKLGILTYIAKWDVPCLVLLSNQGHGCTLSTRLLSSNSDYFQAKDNEHQSFTSGLSATNAGRRLPSISTDTDTSGVFSMKTSGGIISSPQPPSKRHRRYLGSILNFWEGCFVKKQVRVK